MRAIGEVDYENAKIIAGRSLGPGDAQARVAVVGQLYAQQRLGIGEPSAAALGVRELVLNGQSFQIGIYTTQNDFVRRLIPIEAFRATQAGSSRRSSSPWIQLLMSNPWSPI